MRQGLFWLSDAQWTGGGLVGGDAGCVSVDFDRRNPEAKWMQGSKLRRRGGGG
jgi:hypothetical protein